MKEFKDKGDVWDEILNVAYQSEKEGFGKVLGEAVFYESLYFANNSDFVDTESQAMIRSYLYSRESNTPPFATLQETPADFIDKYMIVRDELTHIHNQQVKEQQKNGK